MQATLIFIFAIIAGAVAWLRTLESPPEKITESTDSKAANRMHNIPEK